MNQKQIELYNKKQQRLYAAKTNIGFDIQNIGTNTRTVALPERPSFEEIKEGVWLKKDVIKFPDGNFSNVYDLFWTHHNVKVTPFIHSEKKPFYLLDYMEKNPSILAIMSGSFFFLVDFPQAEPKDYPFHFCVRHHKVMGLLSSDEPILYIKDGELFAKDANAVGTIQIGDTKLEWVGEKHSKFAQTNANSATLYNSGSAKLIKEYDPTSKVRMGRLDYCCS